MITIRTTPGSDHPNSAKTIQISIWMSTTPFTVDTLPETPVLDHVNTAAKYDINAPLKEVPYWFCVGYHSEGNETIYTPVYTTRDRSDLTMLLVPDGANNYLSGDGEWGYYLSPIVYNTYPKLTTWDNPYNMPAIPWDTTGANSTLNLMYDGDKNFALTRFPASKGVSARQLYRSAWIRETGDLYDFWPQEIMQQIDLPIYQGRSMVRGKVRWRSRVPSLEEFLRWYVGYWGGSYDNGLKPVGYLTAPQTRWFITTTPWEADKTKLTAVKLTGETRPVTLDDPLYYAPILTFEAA